MLREMLCCRTSPPSIRTVALSLSETSCMLPGDVLLQKKSAKHKGSG